MKNICSENVRKFSRKHPWWGLVLMKLQDGAITKFKKNVPVAQSTSFGLIISWQLMAQSLDLHIKK